MSKFWVYHDADGNIQAFHSNPDSLSETDKQTGVLYTGVIPEPEIRKGQVSIPKYDILNGIIYHEYAIRPLTVEEQLSEAQAKNKTLEAQATQTSADLQGFMDYYFSTTP